MCRTSRLNHLHRSRMDLQKKKQIKAKWFEETEQTVQQFSRRKNVLSNSMATISKPTNPYVNKKTTKQCAKSLLLSESMTNGTVNT